MRFPRSAHVLPPSLHPCFRTDAEGNIPLSRDWLGLLTRARRFVNTWGDGERPIAAADFFHALGAQPILARVEADLDHEETCETWTGRIPPPLDGEIVANS